MIDSHTFRDHRRDAAMATGCRHAATRGWNFDRIVDESPMWIRALEEALRPRSLVIFAVIGAVCACWWL